MLVVGLHIFFHLPLLVLLIVSVVIDESFAMNPTFLSAWMFCPILILFNSGINPIIYLVKITQFKAEMKGMFHLCCPQNQVENSPEDMGTNTNPLGGTHTINDSLRNENSGSDD